MRILIIEDEYKIADAIRDVLTRETFAVDVCPDGEEGLRTALNDDYDIIILDRMLPGNVDGADICRQLREKNNQTPVLMLTAKGQVQERVEGLHAGADDYLTKPFSFDELLARMNALLRRPRNSLNTILSIGGLTIDTVSKQVWRGRTQIFLSPKEYALLEYMVRNTGKVLSKQNLITHVWDFDADILPNTVESFIGYLRDKVDRPFQLPPLIHTVRGFGYKISEKP